MHKIILSLLLASMLLGTAHAQCTYTVACKCTNTCGTTGGGGTGGGTTGQTVTAGDLMSVFTLNVPGKNSGNVSITSLINTVFAPGVNGVSGYGWAGCEHIINAVNDTRNEFACRVGVWTMTRVDASTIRAVQLPQDNRFKVGVTLTYHLIAPNTIYITARFLVTDASQFPGPGYMVVMFANYMSPVADIHMNFRGVPYAGADEQWIAADASDPANISLAGGSYMGATATKLDTSQAGANSGYNLFSFDYPRFTQPMYCGLSRNNLLFQVMLKPLTASDEPRLTEFRYAIKSDPSNPKPAWDWQNVSHHVVSGQIYGFDAQVLWEPWQNLDHCLANYTTATWN